MDFDLAPEHTMLQDSLRRAFAHAGSGDDPWTRCVEMGLAGLDCRDGDAPAGDLACMMVAQEEIGRALVPVPFVETVVQAASLLRAAGHATLRARYLGAIEHGEAVVVVAHDAAPVRAMRDGDGWRIDGQRSLVPFGDRADAFVVPARVEASAAITLFVVPSSARGLVRVPARRHDRHGAADLRLDDVVVADDARLGPVDGAAALVDGARRMATVALVAEAVGCMDAILALTLDYLRTRQQFGRPLGTFQALQHRAADMYSAVEQARSMMLFATLSASDRDPDIRARAASAAKIQAGRSARFVGQQAIQLHGGIGLADEYRAGHYFQRLTAIELAFGDADDHLASLGERGGLFAASAG